jgi:hypothetical protein
LNEIKPARSRLKGVILVSEFLVTKDHRHTGGEDGAVIDHGSLGNCGVYTHQQLESVVSDLTNAPVFNPQSFMRFGLLDVNSTDYQDAASIVCKFQWNGLTYSNVVCRPTISYEVVPNPNTYSPGDDPSIDSNGFLRNIEVYHIIAVDGNNEWMSEYKRMSSYGLGPSSVTARPLKLRHGQTVTLQMKIEPDFAIQSLYFEILPVFIEDSDDNGGLSGAQRSTT